MRARHKRFGLVLDALRLTACTAIIPAFKKLEKPGFATGAG